MAETLVQQIAKLREELAQAGSDPNDPEVIAATTAGPTQLPIGHAQQAVRLRAGFDYPWRAIEILAAAIDGLIAEDH